MKRSIQKGFVKIEQIPSNRYLYYLTPKGFAEKSRLMAQYLSSSLRFYRQASLSCANLFHECNAEGWNVFYLCGVTELTEIAILQAANCNVEIRAIYDPQVTKSSLMGFPVISTIDEFSEQSVCIVTLLELGQQWEDALLDKLGSQRVRWLDVYRAI